jgi:hypothetical protein
MYNDTLKRIEVRIQNADAMRPENRTEVLAMLETLKSELEELAEDQGDAANSVAGFTEVSTREATRSIANQGLLAIALEGMQHSVEEFEETHPRLVQVINAISISLSNVGI